MLLRYLSIGLGLVLLCLTVFWIRPRTARCPAYEKHAARSMETLNTAQSAYRSQYGRFAQSLEELGPPTLANQRGTSETADLIPTNLANGRSSKYRFLLAPNATGYQILAFPEALEFGERSFYTDESTVIRAHVGRPAWETDPEIP